MDYAELDKQRCELVKASELWQFSLLDSQKLVRFAKDRNVRIFNAGTVEKLWQAGLLRADAVTATCKIDVTSVSFVAEENSTYLYCDTRPVPYLAEGYGGIFSKTNQPELDGLKLFFHPFRLYVLYHIDRVFGSMTSSTQYLQNPDGLANLSNREVESLDRWTSSEQMADRFEHWNRVAELGIVLEPVAYDKVFYGIRWRLPDTQESIERILVERRELVNAFLSTASAQKINEFRQELCRDAELMDRNKMVHVLLRLMAAHERLKLRSSLGACMLFLSMAEIIRRATEEAKGEELPEEDEMGFGQWMQGARQTIYGSERILDASPEIRRDFLTSMELDYGVKVRCYLEGETELGAMISALGDGTSAEFVNLRGQVIERRGKGLSFQASLKNDMTSHVFSVVLLDGDSLDNVRTLKRAAKDGAFFGRFFISSPDIEFGNFMVDELVDILLTFVAHEPEEYPSRSDILSELAATNSGRELFAALRNIGLEHIEKGEDWGVALMSYAVEHPKFPPGHTLAGETRPIFDAAQVIGRARHAGYVRSQNQYEVNPETGELREISSNET